MDASVMASPCFELGRDEIMSNLKLSKNMEKVKIEIKNRWTGSILFEYEKEDNTINDTVEEAVKNGADLGGADLGGANLGGADLGGADLGGADLGGADLGGAYLRGAYLRGAYLRGADLRGAYLGGANLGGADLRGAYLRGADLRGAHLGGADLRGAKNVPFIPMACPTDGEFIGWKKVCDNGILYLVKLLILEDAKRSSATGRKCRCSKARVLDISALQDGKEGPKERKIINTSYDPYVTYEVGKVVEPDSFDDDRFNECSHGIHFFIDKQEAIGY